MLIWAQRLGVEGQKLGSQVGGSPDPSKPRMAALRLHLSPCQPQTTCRYPLSLPIILPVVYAVAWRCDSAGASAFRTPPGRLWATARAATTRLTLRGHEASWRLLCLCRHHLV